MILQSTMLNNKSIYFIEAILVQSRVPERRSESSTGMFKTKCNHMIIPLHDGFVRVIILTHTSK